ncbi:MAG: glycosyltransferase family 4 protein [bacterium]
MTLRVLHIISDLNVGGAGRYLLNLLPGLKAEGVLVQVVCPGGGELERELRERGFEPWLLSEGDASFSWRAVAEIRRYLAQGSYQVVHTHASLAGRVAARLSGVRGLVLTRHGLGRSDKVSFLRRGVGRVVSGALTDRVIAISEAVAAALVAEGVDYRRIRVIPNGIDVGEFAQASGAGVRLELGVGNRPVVGMVARLVPEKAPQDFLRAAALVRRSFPEAIFLLVGSGPLEAELKRRARELGFGEEFRFLGYRRDVAGVTAALDVAVLSSHQEGLGLVLLEAMAAGKPVVATNVGGIPEVVVPDATGLLVPPGQPEALAAAITRVLSDRGLAAALGSEGQRVAWERFSLDAMAQRTAAVYRELVGPEGGG